MIIFFLWQIIFNFGAKILSNYEYIERKKFRSDKKGRSWNKKSYLPIFLSQIKFNLILIQKFTKKKWNFFGKINIFTFSFLF